MTPAAPVPLIGLFLALAVPAHGQTLETVLARGAAYVQTYERALGILIGEERYTQEAFIEGALREARASHAGADAPPITRRLESEFLLTYVLGAAERWLGLRDVLTVDDRRVGGVPRLRHLLATAPETLMAEAHHIAGESARFNIGDVDRGLQVPTMALVVLRADTQRRFVFEKEGEETIDGVAVWEIAFAGRDTPAPGRDAAGQDLPVRGLVWIEPETGRVVRTELRAEEPATRVESRVTVSYGPDADLGLWVPREMTERYIADRTYTMRPQRIYCVARYSNFRRFTADGR